MLFLQPVFLASLFNNWAFAWAGLALVGIPIIIHILNRYRFKIINWAAMDYLLQAVRKNRRRLMFEQWLLLLVRCLVLFLLGLALARPLTCQDSRADSILSQRSGMHVLIIDNSYSMNYETDRANSAGEGAAGPDASHVRTKNHLQQAKVLANDLLQKLSSGRESVCVILAGRPATAIIATPTFDLQAAGDAVMRIEGSYAGHDMAGALQLAARIAQENPRQTNRMLHIFTDDTRTTWAGPQAAAIAEAGRQLSQLYRISVRNLGKGDQWNQAALEVGPAGHLVTTKFQNDFVAVVKRFGGAGTVSLQWNLDQVDLHRSGGVKLDLDTPPQLCQNVKIPAGGPQVLSVAINEKDGLPEDNNRWRVVDVVTEMPVLIVEGDRGLSAMSGSGSFLALALAPPRPDNANDNRNPAGKSSSPFAPELISDIELPNKALPTYRAVILTNVAAVQPAQADQLQKYVEQGGTLMLFMGPQVNGDTYNSVLLGKMPNGKQRRLLPGKLVKPISSDQTQQHAAFTFDFNPQGVLHPYLNPFRNIANSGLNTAQVYTYWQVELAPDSNAERVLSYQSLDAGGSKDASAPAGAKGDPAITVHSVGRGRVVFVSTTANGDWTSFPAKPNYLTLVHELLSGSLSAADQWMNLQVGDKLEVPPGLALTTTPKLFDSSRKPLALDVATNADGQSVYRSAPLPKPGVYTLDIGAKLVPIVANIPPDASDVRTIVPEGVKQALGGIDVELDDDQVPTGEIQQRYRGGGDVGWWFMAIVLVLAVSECFMAMRFGHYRRK